MRTSLRSVPQHDGPLNRSQVYVPLEISPTQPSTWPINDNALRQLHSSEAGSTRGGGLQPYCKRSGASRTVLAWLTVHEEPPCPSAPEGASREAVRCSNNCASIRIPPGPASTQ